MVDVIAGPDVLMGNTVLTCVVSIVVSLSRLYMGLCLVVSVLVSISSKSCGALLVGFVVGISWFVVYWDVGIRSEVEDAIVWLGALWSDLFLSWV